jgi:LysR family cyn operon transcriptional activator
MDLPQLRAFVAIVDAGGVGRAADRLHISQSALSRQLQTLEQELGVQLFSRERRRMLLSAAGEELLGRARGLLVDAEALREKARAFETSGSGIIKLGATPPMIEGPLAQFLGRWRQKYPEVVVHLVEDGGSVLAERLDSGEVHLAYVPAGDDRFEYRLLYPIHVVAAISVNNASSRSRTLEVAEIAKRPLLSLKPGFGSRDWFDSACRDAGVRPAIVMESASHGAVMALAASGFGIGILPSAVSPPAGVRLVPITHAGAPVGRWTMLAWSKRRYLAPYVVTFIEALRSYACRHYPGRQLMKRAPPIASPSQDAAAATLEAGGARRTGRLRKGG